MVKGTKYLLQEESGALFYKIKKTEFAKEFGFFI